MEPITLETKDKKYFLTIDQESINRETLLQIIDNVRIEQLARKVNFDKLLMEFGDETKSNWWKENKERLLNRTK
ncbi:MAG: hypothetical protein LH473_11180 [Chitinophagales bacterium]|nr:hypothetical protein [Chitinophagales bacterium]